MLGGLLGAYGSDEEELEEQEEQDTQQTGQVTLIRDDESGGGLDLSHLTSGPATRQAEADTAAAAAAAGDQQQPHRNQPSASEQPGEVGAAAMDVDGQPQAAGGGGEQPPAADDPRSLLPPEMLQPPEGEVDPAIQARVTNWLHLQRTRGKYINEEIRHSRGYRNPEFFAKMVEHLRVNQCGTSFEPEVFDPSRLPAEDYLDALQKEWAVEEERRKAARAAGHGRVEFTKSGDKQQRQQQRRPAVPPPQPWQKR